MSAPAPRPTRYACPCCGFLTLDEEPPGTFDICLVCFWEDDAVQARDPSCAGGANTVSLTEARASFAAIGASEPRFSGDVRPPRPDEHPLLSLGNCPVCLDSGDLLCLVVRGPDFLVLHCPHCGLTFDEDPSVRLHEVDLPATAPHGLRIARADEVRARGWAATALPDDHWLAQLDTKLVSG